MHTFHVDGPTELHRAFAGAIDIGREDVDVVPALGQAACQGMDGPNRAPIANSRPIGRDDMKNTHLNTGSIARDSVPRRHSVPGGRSGNFAPIHR